MPKGGTKVMTTKSTTENIFLVALVEQNTVKITSLFSVIKSSEIYSYDNFGKIAYYSIMCHVTFISIHF